MLGTPARMDVVAVRERAKSKQLGNRGIELTQIVPIPDWMTVNREGLSGTLNRVPTRAEIAPVVNEQSGEHSHATSAAASSFLPNRPIGIRDSM